MRRLVRSVVPTFLAAVLLVGTAWAGIGLSPVGVDREPTAPADGGVAPVVAAPTAEGIGPGPDAVLEPHEIPAAAAQQVATPAEGPGFRVGAAIASLAPAPEVFGGPGDSWETEACTSLDDAHLEHDHVVPSLADLRGWPAASPDCVYLGGFGIGPARPARAVGHGGVWVRAIAIGNGDRTFVYAIADTVGWFARYDASVCTGCGVRDVREALAASLGDSVEVGDVIVGSTHTHAGADTYGGWGGVPDWYRTQLTQATIAAAHQAVALMEPASIEVGEVHLRDRNGERRDTYWSTADTGATWLQARAIDDSAPIATWATFAGHPTVVSEQLLHADWPGAAARRFESTFGGVGLMFEGGLGNVSISEVDDEAIAVPAGLSADERRAERTGIAFADAVADHIGDGGTALIDTTMAADVADIVHPATTNPALTTLAAVGLFDREFTPLSEGGGVPGAYSWSKSGETSTNGEDNDAAGPGAVRSCTSAGPVITTTAGAHRIGDAVIAFAPGEIFSNLAEVVKESADRSAITMVLGQTNDALGYIIQSFEFDLQGNIATEYGTQTGEYEEVFSIDRCIGDHVLETLLESTSRLGVSSVRR